MINKYQPAIKAIELESLLWFEIVLVFVILGSIWNAFCRNTKSERLYRFSCQPLAINGPWAKSSPIPVFVTKLCWNTATYLFS